MKERVRVMNERIRKLAEQADILFYKEHIPDTGFVYEGAEVTKEDLQKFAELILEECANAIVNESRLNDVRSAANGCVRTIKQHFGVES